MFLSYVFLMTLCLAAATTQPEGQSRLFSDPVWFALFALAQAVIFKWMDSRNKTRNADVKADIQDLSNKADASADVAVEVRKTLDNKAIVDKEALDHNTKVTEGIHKLVNGATTKNLRTIMELTKAVAAFDPKSAEAALAAETATRVYNEHVAKELAAGTVE